jgi:hypothetical protein
VSALDRHEEACSRGTHRNSVLEYCWFLGVLHRAEERKAPCVEVMSDRHLALTCTVRPYRWIDLLQNMYGELSLHAVEEF